MTSEIRRASMAVTPPVKNEILASAPGVVAELGLQLQVRRRAWREDHGGPRTVTYSSAQHSRIASGGVQQEHRRRRPADSERRMAPAHQQGPLRRPDARLFELHHDPAVEAKRLQRRIETLGFEVTLTAKAA